MDIKFLLIFLIIIIVLIYFTIEKNDSFDDIFEEKFENTNDNLDIVSQYDKIFSLGKLVERVHNFFERKKIKYWISGGTLLGAVRDKGIVQWDDYANLCILRESENTLLKMKLDLVSNKLGVSNWFGGYRVYDLEGTPIPNKKFKYPFIDIFVCEKIDGKVQFASKIARKLWANEFFYPQELFPLRLYDFEKFKLYGPNEANNHLDRIYPNWRKDDIAANNYFKHRCFDRVKFQPVFNKTKKPYLWQYWDNIDGKETPVFIELSMKTVDKHCSKSFNVIRLNKDNIMNYIPEIERFKPILDTLIIAHRVDIYRIMLLYKYGGLYMDADLICLRDPIEVIDKLNKYDYVGFGCTGDVCKLGYGEPSNWIMASRPNGILMGNVLKNIINKIGTEKKFEYHDLGKMLLWQELDTLIKQHNYEYFQYPNKVDGSRDKDGLWVDTEVVFSDMHIEYEDEENMLFYVYYNSGVKPEIKTMTKEQILTKNWNFTKFLKRGLGLV